MRIAIGSRGRKKLRVVGTLDRIEVGDMSSLMAANLLNFRTLRAGLIMNSMTKLLWAHCLGGFTMRRYGDG